MQSTIRKHLSLAKVNSTMSIIINNWRMDPSLNALIHCETGETRRLGEYHFILLETLAKMPMWFYRDLIYVPKYGRTALSAETACRRRSMRCALLSMMMANNRTLLKQFRRKVTYAIKSMSLPDSSPAKKTDYYRPDTGNSTRRDIFYNTACDC